ncbi:MAG: peptidyl-prolyl cis-trans isomerase [Pirellulales bacterium]
MTQPPQRHERRRRCLNGGLARIAFVVVLGASLPAAGQILPRDLETPLPAPLIPSPGRPGTPGGTAYDPNVGGAVMAPGQFPGSITNQAGFSPVGAPTAPTSSSRPASWPGGRAPQEPRLLDVPPEGETLSGSPFARDFDRQFDPEAARAARVQMQRRSRPLGGPPSPPPTTLSRPINKVLNSDYDLGGRDLAPVEYAGPSDLFSGADQGVVQAQYVDSGGPAVIMGPTVGQSGNMTVPGRGSLMARATLPRPSPRPAPPPQADFEDPSRHAAAAAAEMPVFEPDDEIGPTTILARVDQQVIIAGDVLPDVNAQMIKHADKIPKNQVKVIRRGLMQQQLAQLAQTRLVYADAMHDIPEQAHERIDKMMGEMFEKEALPRMLRLAKVDNRADLDAALRRTGSTLDIEKRSWIEGEMAKQWVGQHLNFDEEITHQEMLDYYRNNPHEYEIKASVLWEELKVNYRGVAGRAKAWQRLATAGNQVLAGRPLADAAKEISTGATASEGGRRDWTNYGSLVNKQLEDLLFQIPVNQLSTIVDDGKALYIVRVLERRQAGTVSFVEAQSAIREKIRDQHLQQQHKEFIEGVVKKYRVWTIFDGTPDPVTGVMPPASLRAMASPTTTTR